MKKQMICISGNIAVGKSEVATKLAKKLKYKLYKASESFRQMARDNNMSLLEFNDYVKSNPDIDKAIEEKTKQTIENNNKMIIDARLGFYMSNNTFKVYMVADEAIAAKRLFEASKTRGKEEEYSNVEEAQNAIKIREASEQERYKKLYKVDIHDLDNYDFVIDTTDMNSDAVTAIILRAYEVWCAVDFNEG